MRSLSIVGLVLFVLLAPGANAFADVQLSIRDGQISIVATNATVGQILAEWARVGHTTIVNLEQIPREPITIELTNVSEPTALDVVLRTASGYVAAPRPVHDPNVSRFDPIVIMPPSVVPPPVAPTPAIAARSGASPPQYRVPGDADQPVTAQPAPTEDPATDEDPVPLDIAGASPIPDQHAQVANRSRQALETVDPRSFRLPTQAAGGVLVVPRPNTAPPPARVGVPGMIVPAPAPRPPGAAK